MYLLVFQCAAKVRRQIVWILRHSFEGAVHDLTQAGILASRSLLAESTGRQFTQLGHNSLLAVFANSIELRVSACCVRGTAATPYDRPANKFGHL